MIRSMTGFARLKRDTRWGEAHVTIKSVNHRAFDLQVSLPSSLDPFEIDLRAAVKRRAARGHIELRVALERPAGAGITVRRDLLEAYLAAFREVSEAYGLTGTVDLNAALGIPGMLQENHAGAAEAAEQDVRAELVAAVEACCELWNRTREREGAELAADMRARARTIRQLVSSLSGLREAASLALKQRLEERAAELSLKLEPARLAQEVALLVERSDIAEEVARLSIHAQQLDELLAEAGEIGKRLDFLLQEMNRETNTILSKSANAGEAGLAISDVALTVKAEIEKIREQSWNVE